MILLLGFLGGSAVTFLVLLFWPYRCVTWYRPATVHEPKSTADVRPPLEELYRDSHQNADIFRRVISYALRLEAGKGPIVDFNKEDSK